LKPFKKATMTSHFKMAKIARSARISNRWCFALNNPTQEEIEQIQEKKDKFDFIIGGLEHAPTTGTHAPTVHGVVD
jgi:hypothetical protein